MSTKVAVIGSNAFSGSDFVDLLLDRGSYDVVGLSRSSEEDTGEIFLPYKRHVAASFKFHQLDLNHDMPKIIELLDSFQPDYIVNFAAQSEVAPSWKTPWEWFETNVVSLSRLGHYLAGVKYLKRYVHISSPEIYGSCRGIKEDAAMNPSTPYAASKAAADLFLFTLVKQYNFPLVMIRSTNVYGAHQQLHKIIPKSIRCIKMGEVIPLDGGGKAAKSFIHIRDISRGELVAMEKGRPGEIYHLSPDQAVAVRDVVRNICAIMGADFTKVTKDVAERPGQDSIYFINSDKARQEFGWLPQISLNDGLKDVVAWMNSHWDKIKTLPAQYVHQQ